MHAFNLFSQEKEEEKKRNPDSALLFSFLPSLCSLYHKRTLVCEEHKHTHTRFILLLSCYCTLFLFLLFDAMSFYISMVCIRYIWWWIPVDLWCSLSLFFLSFSYDYCWFVSGIEKQEKKWKDNDDCDHKCKIIFVNSQV